MSKTELLKELRTNKKLFAYVSYNDNGGTYLQMVKSDFISAILEMDEDTNFTNVSISEKTIYIN